MKRKMLICLGLVAPLVFFEACTAKVYVIDRHTVMEDEAAGVWPEFDREISDKAKEPGPTAFQKADVNTKQKRLYNVLNGEMTTSPAKPASPTKK
jgi:hypothetical protein